MTHRLRAGYLQRTVLFTVIASCVFSFFIALLPVRTYADDTPSSKDVDLVNVEITKVSHAVLPGNTDLTLGVTVTNNSQSAVTAERISASQSPTALTNPSQLYSWMSEGTSSYMIPSSAQDLNETIAPGEQGDFSITIPASSLHWSHNAYRWATHGVQANLRIRGSLSDSQDGAQSSYSLVFDRSTVVAKPEYDIKPMPLTAVTTLTALNLRSIEGTAMLPELLANIVGSSMNPDNQGKTGEHATANSEDTSESDQASSGDHTSSGNHTVSGNHAAADDEAALGTLLAGLDRQGITILADFCGLPAHVNNKLITLRNAEVSSTLAANADVSALIHSDDASILPDIIQTTRNAHAGITGKPAASSPASTTSSANTPETNTPVAKNQTLNYLYLPGTLDTLTVKAVPSSEFNTLLYDSDAAGAANEDARPLTAHVALNVIPEEEPAQNVQLDAVQIDSAITSALRGTLRMPFRDETVGLDSADRTNIAIALSAIYYNDAPSINRSTVFFFDTSTTSSNTIASLLTLPWVKPQPLSAIITEEPSQSELVLPAHAPNYGEISSNELKRITEQIASARKYLSIFEDSDAYIRKLEPFTYELLDAQYRHYTRERTAAINSLAPGNELLSKIKVESSSTINMISADASIPVRVTNTHDKEITVNVRIVQGRSPLTPSEDATVTIPPGVTITAQVPVQARASGKASVDVHVLSPDGVTAGAKNTYDVTIHSNWESTGTIVFAILTLAVLIIGIVRSIRRGKRAKPMKAQEFTAAIDEQRKARIDAQH